MVFLQCCVPSSLSSLAGKQKKRASRQLHLKIWVSQCRWRSAASICRLSPFWGVVICTDTSVTKHLYPDWCNLQAGCDRSFLMLFHQPDVCCISVFMSFRSFMKRMSQAAVNDLLTYWSRREDGVQCFSFCLFKDTSPPYVRAAQGSFTVKHCLI